VLSTLHREHARPTAPPTRWERLQTGYLARAPRLIWAFSALVGLLTLVGGLMPSEHHRVRVITDPLGIPATAAAAAVSAVAGLLLLRLAASLRKRKRVAWVASVTVTTILVVAHILKGHKIVDAAIAFALLVMLVTARAQYRAKADPRSRWFAVRVFFQFTAAAIVYGVAMLYIDSDNHVIGNPSFSARLHEVLCGLVGTEGQVALTGERFSDIFHGTLLGFGLLIACVVALLALRASEPACRLSPSDEHRLRTLLTRQGAGDSLGYFALRRDKSVVWSPTGKAAITYRVVQGVALASGDPIGDPEAWPGAMHAYRQLVDEYGWTPAVIGCSELGATVFKRECGLAAIELGDEAIVDVGDFTLEGRPMRGVRQACTRVCRAGYVVRVRRAQDIDPDEFTELLRVAAAWRGAAVERGFSMALSRLGDAADGNCVVATAHQDGVLRGMLHFVPWGSDGLSLDLMRRDRTADNGLNELMIVKVVEACSDLGVKRVSLNFAVFRDAIERGEKIGAGPVLRAWRGMLVFASRWWQIESLYRFNVKFRPAWEPRFLSYPATCDLPRIAVAALEAEAFLVRPHLLKRLVGRV
jgi:lysyl-tRNA synthetase class 2